MRKISEYIYYSTTVFLLIAILPNSSVEASSENEYCTSPGSPTAAGCTCFHCKSQYYHISIILFQLHVHNKWFNTDINSKEHFVQYVQNLNRQRHTMLFLTYVVFMCHKESLCKSWGWFVAKCSSFYFSVSRILIVCVSGWWCGIWWCVRACMCSRGWRSD